MIRPLTIIKLGLVASGILAIVALIVFGIQQWISYQNTQTRVGNEQAAEALNQRLLSQFPESPTIEHTKRYLLFCNEVYRPDNPDEVVTPTIFLSRWQRQIDYEGPQLAIQTARACHADPLNIDPSPPLIRPFVILDPPTPHPTIHRTPTPEPPPPDLIIGQHEPTQEPSTPLSPEPTTQE